MRILMLSWEYPPFSVGGLAQHVYELSQALVSEGVDVTVITTAPEEPVTETINGVSVHRVQPYSGRSLNFISWVQQLNLAFMERGAYLLNDSKFDIIHGHDWLACHAARGLKNIYHTPLIATIHATEHGRNGGLYTDEQKYIGEVEWQLTYDSWRTICCSAYMEEELVAVFQLPRDKIDVIPNGVRPESFQTDKKDADIIKKYSPRGEKIIFYIGRLVQEKGVQDLLSAAPMVREQHGDVKFVIAGTGPFEEELLRIHALAGLEEYVTFAGYIDDYTRNQLYQIASAAVFPSRYEPFGIVALEAMAAGTPVIAGNTGGFQEIISNGQNGLKAAPGDPRSLAEQINMVLSSPALAKEMSSTALREIRSKYSWLSIARRTSEVYRETALSADAFSWKRELEKRNKTKGQVEFVEPSESQSHSYEMPVK